MPKNRETIAISIPTGIGAEVGGYAGDFGYIAREFSKYFNLIINPNAVNGGVFSAINENMYYLEGYLFDAFLNGEIEIEPLKRFEQNKIGIIFDCAIPKDILNLHINTIEALKIVKGLDIKEIEYTDSPVGVEIVIENAISTGNIKNPNALISSAQKLINKGCEAIAVVCYFSELNELNELDEYINKTDTDEINKNYEQGNGIDPIGGVEAIISHLIAKEFNIPSAHSPAFSEIEISTELENKKVVSELVSPTFLPCILEGLSIAPKILPKNFAKKTSSNTLDYKDIKYFIVPKDALGSKAVLAAAKNNIKIVTVKNETKMNVGKEKLLLEPYLEFENYEKCLSYLSKNILYKG